MTEPPRGREQVRAALLEAARRRFAGEGLSASLRDIAGDAGVNLGLLHRHYGSKQSLIGAVMHDVASSAAASFAEADSLDQMLATVVDHSLAHTDELDAYVRILAWILLSGEEPVRYQGDFPAIGRLVDRAGPERRGEILLTLLVAFGWEIFSAYLSARLGYGSEGDAASDLSRVFAALKSDMDS